MLNGRDRVHTNLADVQLSSRVPAQRLAGTGQRTAAQSAAEVSRRRPP